MASSQAFRSLPSVANLAGGAHDHYLFDLNRDWLPLTQPEIGRVKTFQEFFPLVHDIRMGRSVIFPPPARPSIPTVDGGNA